VVWGPVEDDTNSLVVVPVVVKIVIMTEEDCVSEALELKLSVFEV
jgi:hypothetical protein